MKKSVARSKIKDSLTPCLSLRATHVCLRIRRGPDHVDHRPVPDIAPPVLLLRPLGPSHFVGTNASYGQSFLTEHRVLACGEKWKEDITHLSRIVSLFPSLTRSENIVGVAPRSASPFSDALPDKVV